MARLFLNADNSFYTAEVHQACASRDIEANIAHDHRRALVEHVNVWLKSLKSLLVRNDIDISNWLVFCWPVFVILFLRRISTKLTF